MKKIVMASVIGLAAVSASALELGVSGTRDFSGADNRNGMGLSLTHRMGSVGFTAGVERVTEGSNNQNRYSAVAGYDVAKVGMFTVTPKLGVAYVDNQTGSDGYAMSVGAGVSMPVTKTIVLGLDLSRQYGQDRVKASDGNRVTLGLSYKF
jgi:hypothetical protein